MTLAQVSLDTSVVEQAFDAMSASFAGNVDKAVGEIKQATTELLDDEDGELPAALKAFKTELEQQLGVHFNPEDRRSVIAKIDVMMERARGAHVEA